MKTTAYLIALFLAFGIAGRMDYQLRVKHVVLNNAVQQKAYAGCHGDGCEYI